MTKADLINLEFGERNLRKNQVQISHFLSDELDESSGQQPQSVPLFLSNKFWCCFIMLSLIIAGKLSRCILANCAFINRWLAPTVSTICTTTQLTNNQISLLWDRDQQYGWQHYFQFWPAFWFKHFIEWGLSLISSCFWFWYTFPEIQGGREGDP